ncbi:MAG: YkgJ family cysteine cluster protein [Methanimicrococcus sp.]|nr:YkgJ family cysteine cluster protein [Methanimicrococcus sp.]
MMKKAESELDYFHGEEKALAAYPKEHFIEVIRDVGFECDLCGKCCTRSFNGHVSLLKEDVVRIIEIAPDAVCPSPHFDFCDQEGRFYVFGYSLKIKDDAGGSCCFLENGRCAIYEKRPQICRIYPYMIHRETDGRGQYDWREISGLNDHGLYGAEMTEEVAGEIFEDVKKYETDFISQEKEFLKAVSAYFEKNKLKHIQKIHDKRRRDFENGEEITVFVYHDGAFSEHKARK